MSEDVGSGQYIDLLFGTRNLKDKCIIPSKIDLALNYPFEGIIGSESATILGDGSALSGVASSAAELSVDYLAGATYTKMQDMINITQGCGVITGGTITDNEDGSVTVAAGSGICKTIDIDISPTRFIDWAENTNVSLSAGINYVFINYNAGTPVVYVNTDINLWWSFDHIFLGTVWKKLPITLHILNVGIQTNSLSTGVIRRSYEKYGVDHASGALIGSTGTRNITLSAGLFYVGLSRQTSPAFDTSGTDTFSYWWRDGVGGWTELEDQTQIENIHYDDGTGAGNGYPAGIISSKNYGVHWVYLNFDGSCIHIVYGQGDYTASGADDALPPVSLPDVLADYSFLVGKIIVEETQDTLFTFSPFVVAFVGSFVANHNELAGLQGGIADEYFHLTDTEHDDIGPPVTRATNNEVTLATTDETTVNSWTTPNDGKHHNMMNLTYFRVITGATVVTIKVTYTNPAGVAKTITLLNAVSKVVEDYTITPVYVTADPNTLVSIKYTAGTVNQVIVSSDIVEMGAE